MSPSARAPAARRIAVVGAGWAGLAAAVQATLDGQAVTLFDMAPQAGGRARRAVEAHDGHGLPLDNGQHLLIGAYSEVLRLMRAVGVVEHDVLQRRPLALRYADGRGLVLPPGPASLAFLRGVLAMRAYRWRDRLAFLHAASGWMWRGFACDPRLSVADLVHDLPVALRQDLIEPLCVAALNTPAPQASATVFLRVLRDALFSGRGGSDLLLPRVDLGALWPDPALAWLAGRGAKIRLGTRVNRLEIDGTAWQVDGEAFDGVIVAASLAEAIRLTQPHAPAWSSVASGLRYEPIVTVVARSVGARLPLPMLALDASAEHPAQFVFDLGQLRGRGDSDAGTLAFVISGAAAWVALGMDATNEAVLRQARVALAGQLGAPLEIIRTLVEKRATFLCTPGLARPGTAVAAGLCAAGDFVDGPYPATLEGAVRNGVAAVRALQAQSQANIAR